MRILSIATKIIVQMEQGWREEGKTLDQIRKLRWYYQNRQELLKQRMKPTTDYVILSFL